MKANRVDAQLKKTDITNIYDVQTKELSKEDAAKLKSYGELTSEAILKWNPLPLECIDKVWRMSNADICKMIKTYYQKTFHDLKGVNLRYVYGQSKPGDFQLELWFGMNNEPCPSNKLKSVVDLTSISNNNGSDDLFAKKRVLNNISTNKKFTINNETKLLLSDITYENMMPENKKWNDCIIQRVNNLPYNFNGGYAPGSVDISVEVTGCFNINKVLKKLFGNNIVKQTEHTMEDGQYVDKNTESEAAVYWVDYIEPSKRDAMIYYIHVNQFDANQIRERNLKENPIQQYMYGSLYF